MEKTTIRLVPVTPKIHKDGSIYYVKISSSTIDAEISVADTDISTIDAEISGDTRIAVSMSEVFAIAARSTDDTTIYIDVNLVPEVKKYLYSDVDYIWLRDFDVKSFTIFSNLDWVIE